MAVGTPHIPHGGLRCRAGPPVAQQPRDGFDPRLNLRLSLARCP